MKVLIIKSNQNPTVKEIDGSLESMQNIVSGYIQVIYPWRDNVAVVCNEEGKLINLPLNRIIQDDEGRLVDIIAGTFFICYAPAESESFESLPDDLIKKYAYIFSKKEF